MCIKYTGKNLVHVCHGKVDGAKHSLPHGYGVHLMKLTTLPHKAVSPGQVFSQNRLFSVNQLDM